MEKNIFYQLTSCSQQILIYLENSLRKRHYTSHFQVKCAECQVPRFEELEMEKEYNVVLMSFLKNGGDGYTAISTNLLFSDGLETLDIDVLANYIESHSPLIVSLEDRITFA